MKAEQQPNGVGVLARRPDRHRLCRLVPLGCCGTWLQGVRDETLVDELQLDHVVGLRQGFVHLILVSEGPVEALVLVHAVVDEWCVVGHRRSSVNNSRQWFEIDLDEIESVFGDVWGLGDHDCDPITDVAYLVDR